MLLLLFSELLLLLFIIEILVNVYYYIVPQNMVGTRNNYGSSKNENPDVLVVVET